MSSETLDRDIHSLLFGVRRSIRYHYRRVCFFDRIHRMATLLSAISGTATLSSILAKAAPPITLAFASCVTLFSVIDLVFATARRARMHNDFAKRYFDLEKDIIRSESPSESSYREFHVRRLEIEAEEPPPLKVLDAMCHNEMIRAEGYCDSQCVNISWFQRLMSQFCDIREHAIKCQNRSS